MSDRLKLLVLVRTFSKRLTDLTMSLSLPKVETTLMLEGAGGSVGVVDVELARRSNDLSQYFLRDVLDHLEGVSCLFKTVTKFIKSLFQSCFVIDDPVKT